MSPTRTRERLLVHACCAPCATVPVERLRERYELALFFFGPNIQPESEHHLRLEQLRRFCAQAGLAWLEADYDPDCWERSVGWREDQPESSLSPRCQACYRLRMERTADEASARGFGRFTLTLSLSRHKDSAILAALGQQVAQERGLDYLPEDFKKQDGYGLSVRRSRELGLYRQDYCGCRLSRVEAEARRRRRASPE